MVHPRFQRLMPATPGSPTHPPTAGPASQTLDGQASHDLHKRKATGDGRDDNVSKRVRLTAHHTTADDDQEWAEYRATCASEAKDHKPSWSRSFHDRQGVTRGRFTRDAIYKWAESDVPKYYERRAISSVQTTAKGMPPGEVMAFLNGIVTRLYREPELEPVESFTLTSTTWSITGTFRMYSDVEFTVAHALTAIFVNYGQEEMEVCARAFKIFQVFSPDSRRVKVPIKEKTVTRRTVKPVMENDEVEETKQILFTRPISTYTILGSTIATRLWASSPDDQSALVRSTYPTEDEKPKDDPEFAEYPFLKTHRDAIARVLQKGRLPNHYPTITTYHNATSKASTLINDALSTEFFKDNICPLLQETLGKDVDEHLLWAAVMTDGTERINPWSGKAECGSDLGAMKTSKTRSTLPKAKIETKVGGKRGGALTFKPTPTQTPASRPTPTPTPTLIPIPASASTATTKTNLPCTPNEKETKILSSFKSRNFSLDELQKMIQDPRLPKFLTSHVQESIDAMKVAAAAAVATEDFCAEWGIEI